MKRPHAIILTLALLTGVTAFSVVRYLVTARENMDLSARMDRLSNEITSLEQEKQGLEQDLAREQAIKQALESENAKVIANLEETRMKMAEFESMLEESQETVAELDSRISLVKAENAALRDQVQELQLSVSKTQADNQLMRSKLSSVAELKKAIRELRAGVRRARADVTGRLHSVQAVMGNAGFIIKDGKPTPLSGAVRIEVQPLSEEVR